MKKKILDYLITVGDSVSQFFNALLFLSFNANQSISGRAYEERSYSKFWFYFEKLINFLFLKLFGQVEHCKSAYFSDLERAKKVIKNNEATISRSEGNS